MEGNDQVRFCGQCSLNVYNIAEMNLEDAENLIVEKEGRLCLRLYRRSDGTVLTKDCPVGVAQKMKMYATRSCAAAAAVVSVIAWYFLNFKDASKQEAVAEYNAVYHKEVNKGCNRNDNDYKAGKMMMGDYRAEPTPATETGKPQVNPARR